MREIMDPLPLPDLHHLRAASGWLELGSHLEANEELERISPRLRVHPDVLQIRWQIYAKEKKWETCVDTHDVVITFRDNGGVLSGHFQNKWIWQNRASFFDSVRGFIISMRQIGSNVNVLSGNVVVIANDLTWEFPIPVQKQRLGAISCKIIKNANNQDEAEVLPFPIMDMTGRPLGYFDGK
jgi:hypothetical protein